MSETTLLLPCNFRVAFHDASFAGGGAPESIRIADGGFAEIAGLEASMEPRSIREGGWNAGSHQRAGPVSHPTVQLRRGMARVHALQRWFAAVAGGAYGARLDVEIELLDAQGEAQLRCQLRRALAVRYRAADFNARAGEVGIEELQLVHEGLVWSAE